MYAYAANNPVRYIDPDGNDIEEIPVWSVSVGACAAVRLSFGIVFDSKGNIGAFAKFETGVGAGTDIGIDKLLKPFVKGIEKINEIFDEISYTSSGFQIGAKFYSLPEDTGKGNLDHLTKFNWETYNDWNALPSEGAIFIGVDSDKNGNVSPTFGLKAIAAAYLNSGTFYFKVYDKQGWKEIINDLKNLHVFLFEKNSDDLCVDRILDNLYKDRIYKLNEMY